jgi:hypothetical protein
VVYRVKTPREVPFVKNAAPLISAKLTYYKTQRHFALQWPLRWPGY